MPNLNTKIQLDNYFVKYFSTVSLHNLTQPTNNFNPGKFKIALRGEAPRLMLGGR